MTRIWIPIENKDHQVDITNLDPSKWKVIKGRKTVRELIKENIDNVKRTDLTIQKRTELKAHYRV